MVHYRTPEGAPASVTIERGLHIKPQVTARFEVIRAGVLRYAYTVANLPGAGQGIRLFALGVSRPDLLSAFSSPPGWRLPDLTLPGWGTPPRCNWWTYDDNQGLSPGQLTQPFSFETTQLPGLTRLYLEGSHPVPEVGRRGMSEWLMEEIGKNFRTEHGSVQPPVIGPKIVLDSTTRPEEIVAGVRAELMGAAGQRDFPDFEPNRVQAWLAALETGGTQAAAALAVQFSQMGGSPIQRDLFRALAFDLDYAAKMR